MSWEDEDKQRAIQMYQEKEPTPENSMEIVKEIAEEMGQSANGVRMILTKAGVYIKKAQATSSAKSGGSSSGSSGTTRVSKEAAHNQLIKAIEDIGGSVDNEIISKLTGKAALYLAGVLANARAE